ncbi:hypothetical protein [Cyprinid herpesvirus 2]|nr:hypothetical protein [Cyprinid herpesvirus 2]
MLTETLAHAVVRVGAYFHLTLHLIIVRLETRVFLGLDAFLVLRSHREVVAQTGSGVGHKPSPTDLSVLVAQDRVQVFAVRVFLDLFHVTGGRYLFPIEQHAVSDILETERVAPRHYGLWADASVAHVAGVQTRKIISADGPDVGPGVGHPDQRLKHFTALHFNAPSKVDGCITATLQKKNQKSVNREIFFLERGSDITFFNVPSQQKQSFSRQPRIC